MRLQTVLACAVLAAAASTAVADFKVADTTDTVFLVDGTKIEGTVIAVGMRSVIIVVKGEKEGEAKEVVISKANVERIERGGGAKETASYTTDPVDGAKVVTGQGFRDSGSSEPAAGPRPQGQTPAPAAPAGPASVDQNIRKMLESAMGTNPLVKRLVDNAGGLDQAAALIQKNPDLLSRLKTYIDTGGGPGGSAPGVNAPGGGGGRGGRGGGGRQGGGQSAPGKGDRGGRENKEAGG